MHICIIIRCSIWLQVSLCIATVDSERQDFSNEIKTVTFPPSSTEVLQTLNITVFDDSINEATEGYLLMLVVDESMSDPQDVASLQLVNGGTSLIIVLDNDGKSYILIIVLPELNSGPHAILHSAIIATSNILYTHVHRP